MSASSTPPGLSPVTPSGPLPGTSAGPLAATSQNSGRAAGQQRPLQLSILDRITDEVEGGSGRAGSERALRDAVLRDLSWLLNTAYLQSTVDLRPYPEVATSTLNYGTRSLVGLDVNSLDVDAVCRTIVVTLRRFEPRLLPNSIRVTSRGNNGGHLPDLRIEGDLRTRPVPIRMVMRTEADPQLGMIRLVEIKDGRS